MEWTTNMEGGGTLYFRDDGTYLYFEARRSGEKNAIHSEYQVILQGMNGSQLLGTLSLEDGEGKLSRMVSRSTLEKWGCLPVTKVICQKSYGLGMEEPSGEKTQIFEKSVKGNHLLTDVVKPEIREEQEKWEKVEEEMVSGRNLRIGEEKSLVSEHRMENNIEIVSQEEKWLPIQEKKVTLEGFLPCDQPWVFMKNPSIASLLRHYQGVTRREEENGYTFAIPYFSDKEFPLLPLFCFGSIDYLGEEKYVLYSFSKEGKPVINPLA